MVTIPARQYRHEALVVAVGLVGVALLAAVTGTMMSDHYHDSGLADCLAGRPRSACDPLIDRFEARFASLQVLVLPLVLVPGLIGALVGAPLVARELEAGTHRFLWTQAMSPRRWLLTASAHTIGLAAAAGVGLALIAAWWLATVNDITGDRFDELYDLQGVVPVAASILAVAAGIACGVLARRTVPAMAGTIALFVGTRLTIAVLVRPRLAPPRTVSFPFGTPNPLDGTGAWELTNRTVDDAGTLLGRDGSVALTPVADRCPGIPADPADGLPDLETVQRCIERLDVRSVVDYHPADRFWTFQLIESGLLLVAAAALLAVAAASLRRRSA